MSSVINEMVPLDVFAVALGVLGAVGAVVIYLVQSRREASTQNGMMVRTQDLYEIRDATVKDMILAKYVKDTILAKYGDLLSDEQMEAIDAAFARGNEQFISDYLPSVVGKEQAEKLRLGMKNYEMSNFD